MALDSIWQPQINGWLSGQPMPVDDFGKPLPPTLAGLVPPPAPTQQAVLGGRPYDPTKLSPPPQQGPAPSPLAAALTSTPAFPSSPKPVITAGPNNDALAQALLGSANSKAPIFSPIDLLGRLAQVWSGNKLEHEAIAGAEKKKTDEAAAKDAADTARRKSIADAVYAAGDDPNKLWALAISSGDPTVAALAKSQQPGTTTDITDYEYYKKDGGQLSFADWQTKIKGASGAQESTFGSPIFRYNKDNTVAGYDLFTNRGTVYHYDKSGQFIGETRVPPQGSAPATGGPALTGDVAPSPATQSQPFGSPNLPLPAAGGQAPAAPTIPGDVRPPGSVKLADQGTQQGILTPSGAQVGSLPVDVAGKSAANKAGETQAADLAAVNANAIKANTQKSSIALMRRAATDPSFYSGAFGDQVLAVRKLGVALGLDPGLAASMENFQSMSNQLVKDRLGSLGTGVSNADVSFLSRTVPTLDASPQGNQQLLDILEKLADRDIQVAKEAQQYAKEHGSDTRLDAGWATHLTDWAQKNPLFPNAPPSGATEATGGGNGAQPVVQDGATATGPNGQKAVFRGGKWVDATTGQPIQ